LNSRSQLQSALTAALALALGGVMGDAACAAEAPATAAPGAPTPAATKGEFKPYPGATAYTPPETEETKQFVSQLRPGTTITAYFTNDPFDKVVAFYRGIGKEYTRSKVKPARLPNGQPIQKAFLIFDGAADPLHSRNWARIQHPFIGSISKSGTTFEYKDVRDVTEIVVTVRKPEPREKSGPSAPQGG
jgi:hypothetical protein